MAGRRAEEEADFAIVAKTHHCMVDGVSGVDITTVLFDVEKTGGSSARPGGVDPEPEPSGAELLSGMHWSAWSARARWPEGRAGSCAGRAGCSPG